MSEVRLTAGDVVAVVDPVRGARLVSLSFGGHEVVGHADDLASVGESIGTGAYPMVPWAGRIRGGLLEHDGATVALPLESEGNALHGLGRDATWTHDGDGRFSVDLGDPWPESGEAALVYAVRDDGLDVTLTWTPATDTGLGCALGLHPWFRREVGGVEVEAALEPTAMVERASDGLPTGRLVTPTPQPWDDCFRLASAPRLTWPGVLDLELTSTTDWWVVFTEPSGAVCVEPQTVPPDSWAHPELAPERPTSLTLSITRR